MKFEFSLDSVLKVRKHHEDVQKMKLAGEIAKKQEINLLRDEVLQKLKQNLKKKNDDKITNIHQLRRSQKHVEDVIFQAEKIEKDLHKAKESVNAEKEKLAEAYKDRSVIENAKESEMSAFIREMERLEQKFLDDIATQTFSR